MSKHYETGYLRYGSPPESGISHNFRDNTDEKGVSVYRAKFYEDGTFDVLPQNDIQWFTVTSGFDRDVYRVWGEEVGTGSDGEPVLKITRSEKIKDQSIFHWYRVRYQEIDENMVPLGDYVVIAESDDSLKIEDIATQEAKDYEDRVRRDKTIKASRIYEIINIISKKPFSKLTEEERANSDGIVIDEIPVVSYN